MIPAAGSSDFAAGTSRIATDSYQKIPESG